MAHQVVQRLLENQQHLTLEFQGQRPALHRGIDREFMRHRGQHGCRRFPQPLRQIAQGPRFGPDQPHDVPQTFRDFARQVIDFGKILTCLLGVGLFGAGHLTEQRDGSQSAADFIMHIARDALAQRLQFASPLPVVPPQGPADAESRKAGDSQHPGGNAGDDPAGQVLT